MNRSFTVLGCLLLAASTASAWGASASSAAAGLKFSSCQIGAADSSQHLEAQCTTLTVPENRAKPDGKKIGLHIAMLRARAGKPVSDPLFFIAGGPGEASTQSFVKLAPAFDDIRASRDIVLVDQRGTGESNPLNCPTEPPTYGNPTAAEIAQQAQTCLKQLPGDPRYYTTTVAVKDLDAVRQALGYKEINLYGISYGTRVALEYLREFPQHVRSVILDGVVPANLAIGPGVSLDAQRALNGIFARCEQDRDCHQAFPALSKTFAKLQQTLEQHPVKVSLRDPLTGAPLTEMLTWDQVANAVRFMSYASETAALLPLLIHQAGAEEDYAPLMANALFFTEQLNGSIALGMNASVLCTEDVPFYKTDAATQRAMANTYVGSMPVMQLIETCKNWPRGVIAPDFKQPVVSAKPVLLISGQDDPITPPSNAADAARTLSNSLSIVVPGQGHGNAFRGCVPKLMVQFVAQASVKNLDIVCVKKIKPFPFFTSFTGPGP